MNLTQEYRHKFIQLTEENQRMEDAHQSAMRKLQMEMEQKLQAQVDRLDAVNKKQMESFDQCMQQKKDEVRALQDENILLHQSLNKKDIELHETLKRVHAAQERNDELTLKVRSLQEQQLANLASMQTEANQKLETQASEQKEQIQKLSQRHTELCDQLTADKDDQIAELQR